MRQTALAYAQVRIQARYAARPTEAGFAGLFLDRCAAMRPLMSFLGV